MNTICRCDGSLAENIICIAFVVWKTETHWLIAYFGNIEHLFCVGEGSGWRGVQKKNGVYFCDKWHIWEKTTPFCHNISIRNIFARGAKRWGLKMKIRFPLVRYSITNVFYISKYKYASISNSLRVDVA